MARSRVSAKRSVAQVAINRSKTSRVTARLLLRSRGRGEARTAKRRAARRLGAANGPSIPFQRCNVLQLARRRLTVFGAREPSQRSKPSRRKLSATSAGIVHALGGIPEMMRHEFQRERLGRRPRQRLARGARPPRPPNRRGPTRAPADCSHPCLRARGALRSRHRRQ